jgi:hypothetical protein
MLNPDPPAAMEGHPIPAARAGKSWTHPFDYTKYQKKSRFVSTQRMEVVLWEVLSRNGRRRCASTNTGSCWPAPVIKEGKSDNDHT